MRNAFCIRYELDVPIVCAGMAFVGVPELAVAISKAGAMGTLAASTQTLDTLRAWIRQTRSRTKRTFGVNFITQFTTAEQIDLVIEEHVPVVSFHWNNPPVDHIRRLKQAGIAVWMQVGRVDEARRALDADVDALIAQSWEAGGHNTSRTGAMALVPRLVELAEGKPVLAAGGIADGRGLAAALALGAAAGWMGTRFLATREAFAHLRYKDRVVALDVDDTVMTTMFGPEWPGQPTRVMRNDKTAQWAGREHLIPAPKFPPRIIGRTLVGGEPEEMPEFSVILPTPDTQGEFTEMCMVGGQSAGLIREIESASDVVTRTAEEARRVITTLASLAAVEEAKGE